MLLSVVIPAYNAAPYVEACLDSVFALPLAEGEIEVLVVDDGSTDATADVVARCAARRPGLRLLRQSNQGQSVARNRGIVEARGDYIYFVDSDDVLTVPCPLPLNVLRSGRYDIVGVETLRRDGAGHTRPYCRQRFPYGRHYDLARDYLAHHNVLGLVYGHVYRTAFLRDEPLLRFTPGIYHQDEEFVVKAFCLGRGFVFAQGYTYVYIERTGSSIHTPTRARRERLMCDMMVVLHHLTTFLGPDGSDLSPFMAYKLAWMAVDVVRLLVRQGHDEGFARSVLAEMRQMGLFPLPPVAEWRYRAFRLLMRDERSVCFWIRHRRWLAGRV